MLENNRLITRLWLISILPAVTRNRARPEHAVFTRSDHVTATAFRFRRRRLQFPREIPYNMTEHDAVDCICVQSGFDNESCPLLLTERCIYCIILAGRRRVWVDPVKFRFTPGKLKLFSIEIYLCLDVKKGLKIERLRTV